MEPRERVEAGSVLAHALDLRAPARKLDDERPPLVFTAQTTQKQLLAALDDVRPIPSAGTVGEALGALTAAVTPRTVRRALAELDALVTNAAHSRTKRAERALLLARLILLTGLGPKLGIPVGSDLRAARRHLEIDHLRGG